jgi:TMEM175 potassium channel family protein
MLPIRRLETLTDGVFAIAMTLLVLGVELPHGSAPLWSRLWLLWPKLACYALSFVMLGVLWIGHLYQLHHLRRVDRTLIWLNLAFLLVITFLPFSTGVMASENLDAPAVALYGGTVIAAGLALFAHWSYAASRPELAAPGLDPRFVGALKLRIVVGMTLAAVAIAVGYVDTRISLVLFLVLPVAYWSRSRADDLVEDGAA